MLPWGWQACREQTWPSESSAASAVVGRSESVASAKIAETNQGNAGNCENTFAKRKTKRTRRDCGGSDGYGGDGDQTWHHFQEVKSKYSLDFQKPVP